MTIELIKRWERKTIWKKKWTLASILINNRWSRHSENSTGAKYIHEITHIGKDKHIHTHTFKKK